MLLTLLSALAAPPTLAVAPFLVATGDSDLAPLGKGLADMVLTDLCTDAAIRCVERARIAQVLAEFELLKSGFLDPDTAVELGRGVGAELFVFGTLSVAGDQLRIDSHLVRIETGEVVKTVAHTGPRESVFQIEAAVARDLAEALSVTVPVRMATSTSSIVAYGRALEAEDDGRVGVAKTLLAAAARKDPQMVWASARLASLESKVAKASSGRGDALAAEIVALVDGIEGGDSAACLGLQRRYWAVVQPITMGGRVVTIPGDGALDRWREAGLTERPADLTSFKQLVGQQLHGAHAAARLVLDRKLSDSLCPGANPNETVLTGMINALGFVREGAASPAPIAMVAPDGTVARTPNALDDLLLDYADHYVTRFPTGGLHTTLPIWVEPAAERVYGR